MRVLDLFAGLGGWSNVIRERGHEVVRLDFNPAFDVEIHADILTVSAADLGGPGAFDLVLASPPCEAFSTLRIGRNWTREGQPKGPDAERAALIVAATLDIIRELEPSFWVMENPRAKLRVLPVTAGLERRTVTYCQLGRPYMKPTDLWGGFPPSLLLPKPCKNGMPCHLPGPRGSKTGLMDGRSSKQASAERALIPDRLSELVILAAERDLARGTKALLPRPITSVWQDGLDLVVDRHSTYQGEPSTKDPATGRFLAGRPKLWHRHPSGAMVRLPEPMDVPPWGTEGPASPPTVDQLTLEELA